MLTQTKYIMMVICIVISESFYKFGLMIVESIMINTIQLNTKKKFNCHIKF